MKFPWTRFRGEVKFPPKEPETIDMGLESGKLFYWGPYIFCFSCKDDKLYEIETKIPEPYITHFPPSPQLKVGLVLTDAEGQRWLVKTVELVYLNPCYLKNIQQFETLKGQYSPYGWKIFQYEIEKV